jgi:branched-chain amino acid transport system permease protein
MMDVKSPPIADPHAFLAAQVRWRPIEIAFWLATLLPFVLAPSYLVLASHVAIAALFALSLDLILGYAGIISLGHAAFFGFGAYTAGILAKAGWGEPLSGLAGGACAALLLGYVTSFIVMRVSHLSLLMVTLGICLLFYEGANRMGWLTGGDDGLQGVVMWPLLGRFDFDLYGYVAYAYALVVLFVSFLAVRRLIHSPFGLSLRGIRENVRRMPAIGAPTRRRLRTAYTISAGFAGLAGALLAQTSQFVALEVLSFQRSAEILVMLVLGGAGRLYGGLVGAIIFMVARDQLADMNPQYWYFWLGLLLITVVMFLPNGILGGLAQLLARWRAS